MTSLSASTPFSGFAVKDLAQARQFYGETLGLTVSGEGQLAHVRAGDREILMYEQPDATPASYTFLNFPVADVDATVDWLIARGVSFQKYAGMPQDDKGVMRDHGPTIAWFTDPSGNVLSIIAES